MKRCPKCQRWTLEFDDYFGRFRCFDPRCAWMAPSTTERELRRLRSHKQPTELESLDVPELGLSISVSYDGENDALAFDFGLDEPTVDLPEPDGVMIWQVGRHSDRVSGFTIVGAWKSAISKITIEFIARRKEAIERCLRRVPGALATGRVSKNLIDDVRVTAVCEKPKPRSRHSKAEGRWREVVKRVQELPTV